LAQHSDLLPANEVALKNNLFTLRTAIVNCTSDKLKTPQSLQELVTSIYLREIPFDPMTRSNQTWKTIIEEVSQSINQSEAGIFDVTRIRKYGFERQTEWYRMCRH